MKRIILATLLTTLATSSSFASVSRSAFHGLYLGTGLNYTSEKFNINGSFTPTGGATIQKNYSLKANGAGVKLFTGFGSTFSPALYLGAELAVGYDYILGNHTGKDLKSKNKWNYSVAGRLGYATPTFMPYLKFGYEGRPIVHSIKRDGFILGGGIDYALSQKVFIRGEYQHGFGKKSSRTVNMTYNGVNGVLQGNTSTKSDTFMIGAAYRFSI